MFQKSCLLKCIKSNPNEVSLMEQNYGLFKYSDNLTITLNKSKSHKDKSHSSKIQSLKRRINNSFRQKSRSKILQFIRSDKIDLQCSIKSKNNSNVFSSTMISNNSIQSTRVKQFEKDFYTEYSDLSDEDYDDDDDSEISFNIGISNTLKNEDLNSSLSSVSSLEFEPFETSSQINHHIKSTKQQQKRYSKKNIRPKFDPLISSSRSTLSNNSKFTSSCSNESVKKLSYEPITTSSRKSLLLNEEMFLNHCPVCDVEYDLKRENCLQCQHNYSISSNRFLIEENICSSTVLSLIKRNSTFNDIHSDVSSLLKRSLSSSSSSSSVSSSSSSSKLSNEISYIQSTQPNYYALNDTYV